MNHPRLSLRSNPGYIPKYVFNPEGVKTSELIDQDKPFQG